MSSGNSLDRPIPLITISNGKFELGKEAYTILSKVKGKVGVVAIAGLYRTGKSYILNRLLNRQAGFDIGPTVNPQTKGIYIWGSPIDYKTRSGEVIKIILVDTEGIGSLDKDETYDAKIFALAVLLSSFFIYNSFGVIDEGALDKLSFITNLSKHIQSQSGDEDTAELATFFPSFLWLLRDFTLDLVDKQGRPITSKQYLENSLTPVPDSAEGSRGEQTRIKNQIRAAISQYFRNRDCITMVRPTADEKDLRTIDKVPYDKLRPEFRKEAESLRDNIFSAVRPKTLMGTLLDGEGLAILCRTYVDAINKGAVPTVRGAWENIALVENPRVVKEAYETYARKINADVSKKGFPMDETSLQQFHASAEEEATKYFESKKIGNDVDKFRREFKESIKAEYTKIEAANREQAGAMCKTIFKQLSVKAEDKIAKNQYSEVAQLIDDLHSQNDEFIRTAKSKNISESVARLALADLVPQFWRSALTRVTTHLKSEEMKKFEQLGAQLANLRQDYDKTRSEKESAVLAHVKIEAIKNQLEKQVALLNSNITDLNARIRQLSEDKSSLESEIKNASAERASLEQKHIADKAQDAASMKEMKKAFSKEREDYLSKIKVAEEHRNTLESNIKLNVVNIGNMEKTIKNQETTIANLEKEREKEKDTNKRGVAERENLVRTGDEEKRKLLAEKQKIEDEKRKVEGEKEGASKNVERLKQEVGELKEKLVGRKKKSETNKQKADDDRTKLEGERDTANRSIDLLNKEIADLKGKLESEKELLRSRTEAMNSKEAGTKTLTKELDKEREKTAKLESDKSKLESEKSKMEKDKAKLESEKSKVEEDLSALQSKVDKLRSQAEKADGSSKTRIDTLEKSIDSMKKESEDTKKNGELEKAKLIIDLEKAQKAQKQLEAEKEKTEQQLKKQNEETKKTGDQEKTKLKRDLEKAQEAQRQLEVEKEEIQQQLKKENEETKKNGEQEKAKLKRDLEKAQEARRQLEAEKEEIQLQLKKEKEAKVSAIEKAEKMEIDKKETAKRRKIEDEDTKMKEAVVEKKGASSSKAPEKSKKVVAEEKKVEKKPEKKEEKKEEKKVEKKQVEKKTETGKGKRKKPEEDKMDEDEAPIVDHGDAGDMEVEEPPPGEKEAARKAPVKKPVKKAKVAVDRGGFPDPEKLTITELKRQLTQWDVVQPTSAAKKPVYVDLYNKYLDTHT